MKIKSRQDLRFIAREVYAFTQTKQIKEKKKQLHEKKFKKTKAKRNVYKKP